MKTLFVWETDDLVSGRIVVRNDAGELGQMTDPNFASTVAYKIGYVNASGGGKNYTLSSITDGWTQEFDEGGILARLNGEGGFRPVTKDEFFAMLETVNIGFVPTCQIL